MEKNYLEEIVKNAKKEEKLREKKLRHLVRFLKSDRITIISDDDITVNKQKVIDTKK